MKPKHLAFVVGLLAFDFASASVSLLDGEKLSKALKESPPCCVIDLSLIHISEPTRPY